MTPDPRPDGDLVRQKREERGWTQEGLAGKAGVDVQTLRRIERGEGVRRQSLNRVARALGSSIDDLQGVTLKTAARANHGEANLLAGITISLTLPIRTFAIERSLTLSGSRAACAPSALLEASTDGPGRWIVVGEAGAGKTTLLRQLAYEHSSDASPCLPLLVRLSELAQQQDLELEPEALFALEPEAARRQLRSAASRGKVLFLLDGLDEVNPIQREWVRSLLRVAVASWPCPTVVTSRPHGLRRPGGFEIARLDPLSDAQITEFLGRWSGSRQPESPSAQAGLDVLLTAGSELWEVMRNPLLMTFVVLLSERRVLRGDHAWPTTRQELYDQVLVVLLEGLHRLEAAPSVTDPETVVEALAFLAAELTNDGVQAEPRANLAARLRGHTELWNKIAQVPRWAEGPGAFLSEVADRCGVLAEHDGRNTQWRFWHRSLQESLAAKHLRRGLEQEHEHEVLARAEGLDRGGNDAHWIEPYILLCGELPTADDLVRRLLRGDPEIAVRGVENARGLTASTLRDVVEALAGPTDERPQARSFLEAMRNWWSAVGDDARPGLVKGIEYQLGGWIGDDPRAQGNLEQLTLALQRRYIDPIEVDESMERLTRSLPSFTGPLRGAVYLQLGRLLPRPEAVELVMGLWERALERGQGIAEDLFFLDEALARIYDDDAVDRPRDDLYARLAPPAPDLLPWQAIPAGEFTLGSPAAEGGFHWERPQHTVRFARGWEAAATLITNAQFAVFDPHHTVPAGEDASTWSTLPVTGVSWYGAAAFGRWLSRHDRPCRLPTEAEWEYMARAGTTTPFSSGSSEEDLARVGWYRVNAEGRPHPVGSKAPNDWGLFDVHGNAWEWTQDWYGPYESAAVTDPIGPSYGRCRILRGGCFDWDAPWARSAHRSWLPPNARLGNIGLRVVRDLPSDLD